MIFFDCDGEGCTARVRAMESPVSLSVLGAQDPMPPMPPGWRRVEWVEPPVPRPPAVHAPDPFLATVSGLLPANIVERAKKAMEAQRIANEINNGALQRFRQAERREANLCPDCAKSIRIGRWMIAGMTSILETPSVPLLSDSDLAAPDASPRDPPEGRRH